jgi:hypothetical protein
MFANCVIRRACFALLVTVPGACALRAAAAPIPGTSQLGGFVYIDRNNDGDLAFSNEPNPEYVIGGVSISLFLKANNVESLVSTLQTDNFGRYLFENIAPGTYVLRQTQPIEFVDGIDTLGILQSWIGQPIPPSASAGVASNNVFSDIVLTADVGGEFYNFGERGLAAGYVSKRLLLASTPPPPPGNPPPTVPEPASALIAAWACSTFWLLSTARRR